MTKREFETRWKIELKNNNDRYDAISTYHGIYVKTSGTMIKYADNGVKIHCGKKWFSIPCKYIIKIY